MCGVQRTAAAAGSLLYVGPGVQTQAWLQTPMSFLTSPQFFFYYLNSQLSYDASPKTSSVLFSFCQSPSSGCLKLSVVYECESWFFFPLPHCSQRPSASTRAPLLLRGSSSSLSCPFHPAPNCGHGGSRELKAGQSSCL